MTMQVAKDITEAVLMGITKLPDSFLGWDGSIDKDVIIGNFKNYVHRFCGWEFLSVQVKGDVIEVQEPNSCLLKYNIRTGHEIYGRTRHLGLTHSMLSELKHLIQQDASIPE